MDLTESIVLFCMFADMQRKLSDWNHIVFNNDAIACMCVEILLQSRHSFRKPRTVYERIRLSEEYFNVVMHNYDRSQWLRDFRMPKNVFLDLCNLLRFQLTKKPSNFREPISVERKVLACISLLADGAFQRCQEKFGFAQCTMSGFFK